MRIDPVKNPAEMRGSGESGSDLSLTPNSDKNPGVTAPLLALLLSLAPAQTPSTAAPATDSALLAALLTAFEPSPIEIRVLHIENLGLLGDPRALDPLADLALDPDRAIAAAAVRAVGRISTPRAEEILANVVRHPNLGHPLKKAAIEQLVYQRRLSARAFLEETAKSRTQSVAIQRLAQDALQAWGSAEGTTDERSTK